MMAENSQNWEKILQVLKGNSIYCFECDEVVETIVERMKRG